MGKARETEILLVSVRRGIASIYPDVTAERQALGSFRQLSNHRSFQSYKLVATLDEVGKINDRV